MRYDGVERRERAVALARAMERPADVPDLRRDERRAGLRAGGGDERVDRRGVELAEHHPLARVRHRLGRIHVELRDPDRRHHREGVDRRPERAQRLEQLRALVLAAHVHGLDDDELLTTEEVRQLRERRELEDPAHRGDLVRHRPRPVEPRVQHLGRALPGEEEDARVDLRDLVELHLDRRHDAEVAAAAPKRPEELGIVLVVDAAQLAVGRHELDRDDAVRREAELARVPADAAAERVAGDADVGRRAVERGEAELGGARDDLLPLRAGPDAGDAALDVDLDAAQLVGLEQDRVLHRPERLGVVARPLRGDLEAVVPRVLDDRDDVALVLRDGDERRLLHEAEVESLCRGLPAGTARLDHGAAHPTLELLRCIACLDNGHLSLL